MPQPVDKILNLQSSCDLAGYYAAKARLDSPDHEAAHRYLIQCATHLADANMFIKDALGYDILNRNDPPPIEVKPE